MDSNTNYLSDSELNRSNNRNQERRRNNSAESYLLLDSGTRSSSATRKFYDANKSINALKSPLSVETIKLTFLSDLKEARTRNESGTTELACSVEHPKVVDAGNKLLGLEEFHRYVSEYSDKNSKISKAQGFPVDTDLKFYCENSKLYLVRSCSLSQDGGKAACTKGIDNDIDAGNKVLGSEEFQRNISEDSGKTSRAAGVRVNTDLKFYCENSKLHLVRSCNLSGGKTACTKEDFSRTAIKNAPATADVLERSTTEMNPIPAVEFQDKPGVSTTNESLLQTKNVSEIEDHSCESLNLHQDSEDSLCQEHFKTSATETFFPQSMTEKCAVSKRHPLKGSEGVSGVKGLDKIESISPEKHNTIKSSNKSSEHKQDMPPTTADRHESTYGNSKARISSPYQMLESKPAVSETLIGQPRCLTLKQQNQCISPFSEFELDFDFEVCDDIDEVAVDANVQSGNELSLEKNEKETKKCPYPNDMFLDDDSEVTKVQNLSYSNPESPLQSDNNRECSVLEKEEGELSPELHSSTPKDLTDYKLSKESNLEFFSKVNACFFQLDKEFNNIRIPRDSKKLIGHLQDTLRIVKRMDRKLSLLIESVNSRSVKDKKYSKQHDESTVSGNSRNFKDISNDNESKNVPSSKRNVQKVKDKFESHNLRQENKYHDSKLKNSERSTKSDILESKVSHRERNPSRQISPSEMKKEKQRIQSLFKRQMNLITRHVVQKNKMAKRQCLKSKALGNHSEDKMAYGDSSQNLKGRDSSQKLSNLDEVKTLEDMEAFFQMLKEKRPQKPANKEGDVIDYQEKHGTLKFTTKKNKHTEWRSILDNVTTETKSKISTPMVLSTKENNNVSLEKENHSENSSEIRENRRKMDKEILKSRNELSVKNSIDGQLVKYSSNNSFNSSESKMADLSKPPNCKEQRYDKSAMKREKVGDAPRDHSMEGIELQNGKEFNDSFLVERNSKEMECNEPISETRVSDCKADSREIIPKNSKKRTIKKRKHSMLKSSESDSQPELRDQIPPKRKRAHSRSKLSSAEPKNDTPSISKSQSRSRHDSDEEEIDYLEDRLPSELEPKNLVIVADKNLALLDKHFYLKVKGNQIFLQTKGKSRSNKYKDLRSSEEETPRRRKRSRKTDKASHFDPKNAGTTLKEMEDFLQQLRSKKKVASEEQQDLLQSNLQMKEAKFMARIQAKRKAKLMACISETPTITEKEAKFLKDLEKRAREPCDSPETLRKKQKLMQKIRAETDAIVLAQKQCQKNPNSEEDPLSDMKTILNMIREAESGNDTNSKQFLVSFPLKRSDVKQLENITTGKTPALSDESQRFLNSVRAKMRAKKTAGSVDCSDQKQLQKD